MSVEGLFFSGDAGEDVADAKGMRLVIILANSGRSATESDAMPQDQLRQGSSLFSRLCLAIRSFEVRRISQPASKLASDE